MLFIITFDFHVCRYIIKMSLLILNCIILTDFSMSSFPVNITKIIYINTNNCISINDLNVEYLKRLIYNKKLKFFDDVDDLTLWKVNIDIREEYDKFVIFEKPYIKIDIKQDFGGKELNLMLKSG